jgi:hypothetical protein
MAYSQNQQIVVRLSTRPWRSCKIVHSTVTQHCLVKAAIYNIKFTAIGSQHRKNVYYPVTGANSPFRLGIKYCAIYHDILSYCIGVCVNVVL